MNKKQFNIYVLVSQRNGKRYVGMTSDINRRLAEHARGTSRFTSQNRPWKLIYSESFPDKPTAHKREIFLKSGQGRKFLDSLKTI